MALPKTSSRPAPTAKKERKSHQTPIGIACFTHLYEPVSLQDGQPPTYSVLLVYTPEQKEELAPLRKLCIRSAKERFGEDEYETLKRRGKMRMPWRNAGEYEDYGEPFTDGNVMINFKSKEPPGVVDAKAQPILDKNKVYSGCKMLVSYAPWAYDQKGNKGVTLLLNNCQKAGEGKRLSGRPDPSEEFEALEGADDDEDLFGDEEDDDIPF